MNEHRENIEGRLYRTNEIADLLGVSPRTISNWVRDKVIPYFKIGKTLRFDPAKVLKVLNKYEVPVLN